jgi:hypothetical protein
VNEAPIPLQNFFHNPLTEEVGGGIIIYATGSEESENLRFGKKSFSPQGRKLEAFREESQSLNLKRRGCLVKAGFFDEKRLEGSLEPVVFLLSPVQI